MAQMFACSIYGKGVNTVGTAQGQTLAFPANGVVVTPAPSGFPTYNGVTIGSAIQLIPSGTVVNQPTYYTSLSVAAVAALANA